MIRGDLEALTITRARRFAFVKCDKLKLGSFKSIAVIEFGVNNTYGHGIDCFESL